MGGEKLSGAAEPRKEFCYDFANLESYFFPVKMIDGGAQN